MNLALAELQCDQNIDTKRIASFEFSIGDKNTLRFILNTYIFATAILFDTTYENQDFAGFPNEFKERMEEVGSSIRTPILILSKTRSKFGKNDRFRIYQTLKDNPSHSSKEAEAQFA